MQRRSCCALVLASRTRDRQLVFCLMRTAALSNACQESGIDSRSLFLLLIDGAYPDGDTWSSGSSLADAVDAENDVQNRVLTGAPGGSSWESGISWFCGGLTEAAGDVQSGELVVWWELGFALSVLELEAANVPLVASSTSYLVRVPTLILHRACSGDVLCIATTTARLQPMPLFVL